MADARADGNTTIYADGKQVGSTGHWAEIWTGLMPPSTRVVAVHVHNYNATGFLVASFSTGFKTSEEWKCSTTAEVGWTDVDFNDTEWPAAARKDGSVVGIDGDPFWGGATVIWTQADLSGRDMYCRGKIG